MDITDRQRAILFQVVEEYAETASPVGSVTLARLFDVSPATIRAEMGRLESLGLLIQPHTSAGRIPTDAGYRYYVNHLDSDFDHPAPAPARDHSTSSNLPVIFTRPLRSEAERSLERNVHALERRVGAHSHADAAIRSAVDALVELTGNLGLATIGSQLYIAGMARLFTQPEFLDSQRVQAVAELLDNLEPWLKETAPGEPLNIFIGQENPIGKKSDVSLVISKFRSPYSDRSYIGVLGPTRQDYYKITALVRYAGIKLEETL